MILVSIAYLIFNDLMEMIQTNQKNVPHHKIFYAIRVAVSILALTFVSNTTHKSLRIIRLPSMNLLERKSNSSL